jgi:hypothetical protein
MAGTKDQDHEIMNLSFYSTTLTEPSPKEFMAWPPFPRIQKIMKSY